MDYRENMQQSHGYLKALEEERLKIELFQRELPLSLELVTRAIEACKQQKVGPVTECLNGQSDCSEQTTSDGPVFEEFMPVKRSLNSSGEDFDNGELESRNNCPKLNAKNNENVSCQEKKLDWLRSVQLWNQAPDPPQNKSTKVSVIEVKRNGGAFQPFKKEKSKMTTSVGPTATTPAGGEEGQPKKARRCWSPELHRKFLNALQQVGGSHVATPKQIKELMNVDGLTNDEVKSHLQKYRLHNRRPAPAIRSNASTAAPQFVVVGGIWLPPPSHTSGLPTGVVVPMASPAVLPHHQATATLAQEEQRKLTSMSSDSARCNSSSTSSSTRTTTASQA